MQVPSTPPKLSAPIDRERVRRLFSRPERIAPADFLRREISSRMFDRLELIKIAPLRVLDAGCGTGADLDLLQKAYPAAQILGIDAADAPLRASRGQGAKSPHNKSIPVFDGSSLLSNWFSEDDLAPCPRAARNGASAASMPRICAYAIDSGRMPSPMPPPTIGMTMKKKLW